MEKEKMMEFKEGMSLYAMIPFSRPETKKIHIDYVLPSKAYSDETFIVYRVYGTHKRWWHTFLCTVEEMNLYVELAERKKERQQNTKI